MSENSEKIFEAVTNISDELVETADVKRRRPRRAWYVSAVAALLVVVIAVALFRPGGGALAIAEAAYHEYERLPDGITTPDSCFEALTAQFLSGAGEENAVLSPVNIYMALAMLAELTDGESRGQLLELIGAQDIEAVREQAQAIWRACSMDVEEIQSVLASSIWLRDDLGYGVDGLGMVRSLDRFLGHCIDRSQQGGRYDTYCEETECHVFERRLYCHGQALPNFFCLQNLLIRGTVEFMRRMANDIPSGYEPKYLINMVINPIPIPKMMPPLSLIGEVT